MVLLYKTAKTDERKWRKRGPPQTCDFSTSPSHIFTSSLQVQTFLLTPFSLNTCSILTRSCYTLHLHYTLWEYSTLFTTCKYDTFQQLWHFIQSCVSYNHACILVGHVTTYWKHEYVPDRGPGLIFRHDIFLGYERGMSGTELILVECRQIYFLAY